MTELVNGVPGPFPAPRTELSTSDGTQRAESGHRASESYERGAERAPERSLEPMGPQTPFPPRTPALAPVPSAQQRTGDLAARVGSRADRRRDSAEPGADRGTTIIANEVVEKIVAIAARGVAGVHDLGGDVSRVFAAVKERIGLGQPDDDQGVSVRLDGAKATIKVTLVIEYGFVVYSVTDSVRGEVIDVVEKMLGLEVTAVDIVVDDIHVPDA
jgi:uncharacterized alkaline shock family protein YloU